MALVPLNAEYTSYYRVLFCVLRVTNEQYISYICQCS